jgi:chromosome segregation ATPase
MSAPSEALAKFWENLREKSRVRIEHPDLPEELRVAAGELTAALWTKAQAAAQSNLESQLDVAKAEVALAKSAQSIAEERASVLAADLENAHLAIEQAGQRAQELYSQLALERAARASAEDRLIQALDDKTRLQESLVEARRDFGVELDRIRAAAELAEERLRASEERALMEIDRERSSVVRLQKELEAVRRSIVEAEDRYRMEARALQTELGQTRQQLGALEGARSELQAARLELTAELASVRMSASEGTATLAVALRETELAIARANALDVENASLQSRLSEFARTEDDKAREPSAMRRAKRKPTKAVPGTLL